MSIKNLNPYLNFNGDADQAIKLYQSVLGARTENLQRYGDTECVSQFPKSKDRVLHATLRIGEGVIMISDAPDTEKVALEGNIQVCLHFDDKAEMAKQFDGLAAGGQVTMPLQDTFWGAHFGMLTDRHGVRWMFNCDLKKRS